MIKHELRPLNSEATLSPESIYNFAENVRAKEWDLNVPARARELRDGVDKTFLNVILPLYSHLVPKYADGGQILDAGCGLGFLSHAIYNEGFDVTGIDISKDSIAFASLNFHGIKFIKSSIVGFSKRYEHEFDVCILNMVLHNIPNLSANLIAIHHMLRVGGHVIATIPNPKNWFTSKSFAEEYDFSYAEVRNYKIPFSIRNSPPHPSKISYIHRPLGKYYNEITQNKFALIETGHPLNINGNVEDDIQYCVWEKILSAYD